VGRLEPRPTKKRFLRKRKEKSTIIVRRLEKVVKEKEK